MNKLHINWKEVKLGDIVYFNPKESLIKGKIYKKVSMDCLKPKTREIIKYELDKFKGGSKFRNGDTLFARITPCLENGKIAQVSFLDNKEIGFGSTEFIVLREKENITLNDYIYYLFITDKIKNIAIKSMTGTSGRQRVQEDVLKYTIVKLPPLAEQKRIASILSALDDKIELNNKTNKILEEMAQTIFKEWFINFNFPNEDGKPYKKSGGEMIDSELGKIPKGWKVDIISNFFNVTIGKTPPRKEIECFSKNCKDTKWVSISDMGNSGLFIVDTSEYLTSEAIKKYNVNIVPQNTVILSFKLTIGRVSITSEDMTTNEAIAHFNSYNNFINEYLYFYLKIFNYRVLGNTSSIAEAINSKIIKSIKIIIPKENTLNKFHNAVFDMFNLIKNNQIENEKLSNIRDSLLPKLMTPKGRRADGEIRI
ncbi:restriction endonuclease subunit S [Brachyspira aalborgi]|uniref:restriction endonuclease subunit S n=1 Tax=Brachyspira aalborgi TaxID=29522 RepID=UPI002666FBEF|nr:restriction endonuclease subunit S [Brachyspira aalborgi]